VTCLHLEVNHLDLVIQDFQKLLEVVEEIRNPQHLEIESEIPLAYWHLEQPPRSLRYSLLVRHLHPLVVLQTEIQTDAYHRSHL